MFVLKPREIDSNQNAGLDDDEDSHEDNKTIETDFVYNRKLFDLVETAVKPSAFLSAVFSRTRPSVALACFKYDKQIHDDSQ
ncbi:MAG: hypothetical protein AAGU21_02405 [Solidesulfovibrio sp.]|uniref:hypothetical protein n=1 Tax=Solidesulfovibrio sp. TaxID=2910990 RepID=UPI002B21449F|nr:hypothetical protein [Solidesulfovibrio sp.]MEA4854845.1 hypothetical protein [Solidesulfovibrio sp.]